MVTDRRPSHNTMDPLTPDNAGYCYRDRNHFDAFMQKISHRLIRKHGSFIDRLPLWGIFVFSAALIIAIVLTSTLLTRGWTTMFQVLCFVLILWYYSRIWRFVNTIIRRRLCFKCGYFLRKSPTDPDGFGKCSECGQEFNLGYYRHLPHDYQRTQREPDWRESLHPIDRA